MNITIQAIKDRTEEVGECWIWQQGTTNGYPSMKVKGCGCKLVRRIVVELDGRPAAPRQPVIVSCEEPLCVNPKHLQRSSIKAVAKQAAKKGVWSGKARCAKIAAAKRAAPGAKLTMEQAREIRLSEETGPVLAERYGVNRSLIKSIRAGRAWKDYSSPFAGLGARP